MHGCTRLFANEIMIDNTPDYVFADEMRDRLGCLRNSVDNVSVATCFSACVVSYYILNVLRVNCTILPVEHYYFWTTLVLMLRDVSVHVVDEW